MAGNVGKLAARILECHALGLPLPAALYAETVEVRHQPPAPDFDGPWPRAKLFAHNRQELDAWRRMIAGFRHDRIEVAIDGNRVTFRSVLRGILPDGREMNVPIGLVYTVARGLIGAVEAWVDPAEAKDLAAALAQAAADPGAVAP